MNFSYLLAESEVIKAMQLHSRGSLNTMALLITVAAALLFLGLFTELGVIGLAGAIGGVCGYFSVLIIFVPLRAKRAYAENRALRTKIVVDLTESEVTFHTLSGESKLQWQDILNWKKGGGMYLLYLTKSIFLMVPSRAVGEEGKFKEFLERFIGPAKN